MPTEKLACKLDSMERIERARAAPSQLAQYCQNEDKAKNAAAAARAELKALRTSMEEAGRASREGWEYRDVQVEERPNSIDWTIETIRSDTGELVRARPMTAEERRRARQPRLVD